MSNRLRGIEALVETILPQDETVGAADIRAASFVLHYLDVEAPGSASVLAAALDGLAAAQASAPETAGAFADLDDAGRMNVFKALCAHPTEELRDLAATVWRLTIAAFYGEWTGLDDQGRATMTPVGWELTGFHGFG